MRPRTKSRRDAVGYLLLAPSLIGVIGFLLVPVSVVLWLSLHSWNLLGPVRFTGLHNWRSVLTDPEFGHSLLVTLLFVAIVVPLQTVVGYLIATLLSRKFIGDSLFRVLYVLPWMCAPLAVGVIWQWMFAPTGGVLNAIIGHRIEWLSDPALALPATALVSVWANVGYVSLFFIAGIQAIPHDVLDASALDGATGWQRTRWVVLPLLRPTMFFVLVTGMLTAFQTFDTVYALTRGGPDHRTDVIGMRIYTEAFESAGPGRAAVMAVVVFVVTFTIAAAQHLYFRTRTTYEY